MNKEQSRSLSSKIIRFGIVGVLNTLVDLTAFAVLVAISTPALLANVVAWFVAVSFSYVLNSRWSFERNTELAESWSLLRFFGSGALISLGVSSGALLALTPYLGLWPAKIIGVVVAAILNFIAARWSIENRVK